MDRASSGWATLFGRVCRVCSLGWPSEPDSGLLLKSISACHQAATHIPGLDKAEVRGCQFRLIQHQSGETTAGTDHRLQSNPGLADAKGGPVQLDVEISVGRFFLLC